MLVSETITQLSNRFKPDLPMMKKRIETLIEREYLERVEEAAMPTYRYLAWRGIFFVDVGFRCFGALGSWRAWFGAGLCAGCFHVCACFLISRSRWRSGECVHSIALHFIAGCIWACEKCVDASLFIFRSASYWLWVGWLMVGGEPLYCGWRNRWRDHT